MIETTERTTAGSLIRAIFPAAQISREGLIGALAATGVHDVRA